jgi:hypothetical protein
MFGIQNLCEKNLRYDIYNIKTHKKTFSKYEEDDILVRLTQNLMGKSRENC